MKISRVFLDANILLDMIDRDRGRIDRTRHLLAKMLEEGVVLYTSCDILSNIYYVARKQLPKQRLIEEMLRIIEIFEIVEINKTMAKSSLLKNLEAPNLDFEDLLQRACAETRECDLIVSNDKRFVQGDIPVVSTAEAEKLMERS